MMLMPASSDELPDLKTVQFRTTKNLSTEVILMTEIPGTNPPSIVRFSIRYGSDAVPLPGYVVPKSGSSFPSMEMEADVNIDPGIKVALSLNAGKKAAAKIDATKTTETRPRNLIAFI